MRQSDQLLREWERKGLLTNYVVRFLSLIFLVLGHLATHHSMIEVVLIGALGAVFFALLSVFFYFVYKDRLLIAAGSVGVFTDIVILVFLPYTWYTSVSATSAVPLAYLPKTSLPLWALCFVGTSALALRWQYPAVVAGGFLITWEVMMQIALAAPDTIITKSFVEALMGPAIIPGYYRAAEGAVIILALAVGFITYSYRNSIMNAVRLEVTNTQMGRYFSPQVAGRLAEDGEQFVGLAGRNQDVAVLFCDVRNFTSMSETLTPEATVDLLRAYHSRMVDEIFAGGGTIDKFLGDGIMVTFGTPDPAGDDCYRSVLTAVRMRLALIELNKEREAAGQTAIENGIGIHFGAVVAGNIGTESRMEYTVIGDTVNAAARIESACKKLEQPVLISDSVYDGMTETEKESLVKEFGCRFEKMASLTVKGKQTALNLYAVELG